MEKGFFENIHIICDYPNPFIMIAIDPDLFTANHIIFQLDCLWIIILNTMKINIRKSLGLNINIFYNKWYDDLFTKTLQEWLILQKANYWSELYTQRTVLTKYRKDHQ